MFKNKKIIKVYRENKYFIYKIKNIKYDDVKFKYINASLNNDYITFEYINKNNENRPIKILKDMIEKYNYFIYGNVEIKIINTFYNYKINEIEDITKNFNDVYLSTNNNINKVEN